jgi:hypothetical protein
VQQIHATNAMVDQYYMESLPMLLQVKLRKAIVALVYSGLKVV